MADKLLLTVADVAEWIRLPDDHIRDAIRRGQLYATKIGKAYYIHRNEVERFAATFDRPAHNLDTNNDGPVMGNVGGASTLYGWKSGVIPLPNRGRSATMGND
jgi:excisionase family DNA binding protein